MNRSVSRQNKEIKKNLTEDEKGNSIPSEAAKKARTCEMKYHSFSLRRFVQSWRSFEKSISSAVVTIVIIDSLIKLDLLRGQLKGEFFQCGSSL
jgi:hypothetical protein